MVDIDQILDQIDRLPALPSSVVRVTDMLTSGATDLGEIEQIVRHDEALSMAILRQANSARYGRPGRMFDLKQSIVRLGGKVLMKIVLEQQASAMFVRAGAAYGLRRGALWRGALGGALAADQIARTHDFADKDLCFLCGLLRDVGKLVMDMHFGSEYLSLISKHMRPEHTFVECERAAFGFDHAQIGGELAGRWGLPERICKTIRFHHEPPAEAPEHDLLVDIVHAADIICLWAGLAIGYDGLQYKLAPHVREGLGLDRREAELDVSLTWCRLREIEESMENALVQEHDS